MLKQWISRLTLAAAITATATGAQADEQKVLNFGIISTESSQNLKTTWEPLLEEMEEALDMEVKAFFAPDYAGIIQGMRFDKVDVAWYGNKSAMEAVDRANGEVFAQTVAADGSPGYWSLMIVHKDNDKLNSVDDVLANANDLAFGNGDPNSTSGFLVPSYYIFAKNGVNPKVAFKRMLNASHETNAMAVANKQVDVATFNTESMDRLKVTNPDKAAQLKVVWKSPLIPSDPLVWRKNLPEATKDKVYNFLMSYGADGDKEELAVLEALQWAPMRPSSNDQLIPIRQLELFKQKANIENDDSLDADERTQKLAEIDAQLSGLERRLAALDAARETN